MERFAASCDLCGEAVGQEEEHLQHHLARRHRDVTFGCGDCPHVALDLVTVQEHCGKEHGHHGDIVMPACLESR